MSYVSVEVSGCSCQFNVYGSKEFIHSSIATYARVPSPHSGFRTRFLRRSASVFGSVPRPDFLLPVSAACSDSGSDFFLFFLFRRMFRFGFLVPRLHHRGGGRWVMSLLLERVDAGALPLCTRGRTAQARPCSPGGPQAHPATVAEVCMMYVLALL